MMNFYKLNLQMHLGDKLIHLFIVLYFKLSSLTVSQATRKKHVSLQNRMKKKSC